LLSAADLMLSVLVQYNPYSIWTSEMTHHTKNWYGMWDTDLIKICKFYWWHCLIWHLLCLTENKKNCLWLCSLSLVWFTSQHWIYMCNTWTLSSVRSVKYHRMYSGLAQGFLVCPRQIFSIVPLPPPINFRK
jgi:hypothetical protein